VLGKRWEAADATIVAMRPWTTSDEGRVQKWEFVADVRPSNGPPFRATFHDGFFVRKAGTPSVGEVVGVLFDPKSHKVKFDQSDLAPEPRPDPFQAAASAAPGTPVPGQFPGIVEALSSIAAANPAAPNAPAADPTERLAKLQALKDQGVLSDAEYQAQRQKILDAI
jgi:hypothetical protein